MKKILNILMITILIFIVSCDNKTTSFIESTTPYKLETNQTEYGSKTYIVDKENNPVLFLSTEVRLDLLVLADQITIEELNEYFLLASTHGFNSLELPIMWSLFEVGESIYDFSFIKGILDLSKQYNIKLNFNWYGSFVDGETRSSYLPDYIYENRSKYPFLSILYDFGVLGKVGIIDLTDEDLIKAETMAVQSLLSYVNQWSSEQSYYPLVQLQIGQGLDRFPRWRINQYEILEDGILMTSTKGWELVNSYIENLANSAKTSSYVPITRVEFTEQNAVVNYVYDIYNIDSVDLVSPTYLHTMPNVKTGMKSFGDEFDSMPLINAQNWADDMSYRLLLASFALGGTGFNSYPLTIPRYYPVSNSGFIFGRYNPDSETKFIEQNERAKNLQEIMLGLQKCYVEVAKTPRRNFLTLGLDNRIEANSSQYLYSSNGLLVEAKILNNGIGYIISSNGYVYIYSTEQGTIHFDNVTFLNASFGYFNENGSWENEGSQALLNNNLTIEILPNTLYRLKVYNLNPLPEGIPDSYVNSYDSIRE